MTAYLYKMNYTVFWFRLGLYIMRQPNIFRSRLKVCAIALTSSILVSCFKTPELFSKSADTTVTPSQFSSEPLEVSLSLQKLFIKDAVLQDYLKNSLSNNADLKISAAALEEAGFYSKIAKTNRLPSIEFSTFSQRSQRLFAGTPFLLNNFGAGFDVSWELDVWGRLKANRKAVKFDEMALSSDYEAAKQSLQAQIMQAYFTLLATEKLVGLAEDQLTNISKTYESLNRAYESGTAELTDLNLAEIDFHNAVSALAATRDTHQQTSKALSLLIGNSPKMLKTSGEWPFISKKIKAGISSDLLKKRPDIQAAYIRLLASDERIKIAHKDLFPSFRLTGSFGRESTVLEQLSESRFSTWSILGNISAPIFASGSLKAELGASQARAKAELANYQKTVLTALQEVDNALGSERFLLKQHEATQLALTAAKKAEKQTLDQYESGLTDLSTLLELQRRTYAIQEDAININLQRYHNRISLALALGKSI